MAVMVEKYFVREQKAQDKQNHGDETKENEKVYYTGVWNSIFGTNIAVLTLHYKDTRVQFAGISLLCCYRTPR